MARLSLTALLAIGLACGPLTTAAARADFLKDMQAAAKAGANPKVRGRVLLSDGKVLTCFIGVKVGYIGPPDMMSPAYQTRDPRSGRPQIRTGQIPTVVWLPPATLTSNDCDSLDKMGVLKADGAPAPPPPVQAPPPLETPDARKVAEAATLCKISPALASSLRDEAMRFIRIDGGRIVMSEKQRGKREVAALDGEDFAQRAIEAAAGIAARGARCGQAYWDNEAIQQASAALQR
jgi:hypothetical protein